MTSHDIISMVALLPLCDYKSQSYITPIERRVHAVNWTLKKRKAHAESWDIKKRKSLAGSRDLKNGEMATPSRHYLLTGDRNMENLRIYRIEDHYIRFMHSRDNRVQFNKGNKRPYVGVVLHIGGYQYFVPMESPKPNHAKIKAGKHILKLDNGNLGQLGFNNMLPVHETALLEFDIDTEQDVKYRELLKRQVRICNKAKADIYDKASRTYFDVVNRKNKFLVEISCDFKRLEKACKEYRPKKQS